MSFRIWKKGEGAESREARPVARAEAVPATIPPELMAAARRRITWLALCTGAITAVFGVVDRALEQTPPGSAPDILWIVGVGGALGAALVMAWKASHRMLAPDRHVDAARICEVAVGL